jgi:colicin import membrane protein
MTSATLGRDPFMPGPARGRGPALVLALLAHALLIAALAFGVHWKNSEPTTMAAELWSAVPQAAAPRAAEPTPTPATPPPEMKKPAPVARSAVPVAPPAREAPPPPDPQIAIEQARRVKAERELAEREDAARQEAAREKAAREKQRAKTELSQQKAAADKANVDKLKAEKAKAERDKMERDKTERERAERLKSDQAKTEQADKADAARLASAREANLKRMLGQAGATGGATDTGTAARSSGPSASYAGRIMARIKPNIVFGESVDGNPMATVEVKLAPDGTIVAKRLVKSSGVKSWDDAVLRAIDRTEILPRDIDGRVPPPFQIDFRLRD